jgi:hypothetical protein
MDDNSLTLDALVNFLVQAGLTPEKRGESVVACSIDVTGMQYTAVMTLQLGGTAIRLHAENVLPDRIFAGSRYKHSFHSFFKRMSASAPAICFEEQDSGHIFPVVKMIAGATPLSDAVLKRALHILGAGAYQVATFGPRLLSYGKVDFRQPEDNSDEVNARMAMSNVDRHKAMMSFIASPAGSEVLKEMAEDSHDSYMDLIDAVLSHALLQQAVAAFDK